MNEWNSDIHFVVSPCSLRRIKISIIIHLRMTFVNYNHRLTTDRSSSEFPYSSFTPGHIFPAGSWIHLYPCLSPLPASHLRSYSTKKLSLISGHQTTAQDVSSTQNSLHPSCLAQFTITSSRSCAVTPTSYPLAGAKCPSMVQHLRGICTLVSHATPKLEAI